MREVKDRLQGGLQLTATTVQVLLFAVNIVVCTWKNKGKTKVTMMSRTGEECKICVERE